MIEHLKPVIEDSRQNALSIWLLLIKIGWHEQADELLNNINRKNLRGEWQESVLRHVKINGQPQKISLD